MKVTLSEEDARSLTHPEYAPHGVECEAEWRNPNHNELYMSPELRSGLVRREGVWSSVNRIVVTPRQPSLARLVKESGWRSPFAWPCCLHWQSCYGKEAWYHAGHKMASHAAPPINGPRGTCVDIKVDSDGYPIVEGGDA